MGWKLRLKDMTIGSRTAIKSWQEQKKDLDIEPPPHTSEFIKGIVLIKGWKQWEI
jgi:hypothetical protein